MHSVSMHTPKTRILLRSRPFGDSDVCVSMPQVGVVSVTKSSIARNFVSIDPLHCNMRGIAWVSVIVSMLIRLIMHF